VKNKAFVTADVCHYIFKHPADSVRGDKIRIEIMRADLTDLWWNRGPSYSEAQDNAHIDSGSFELEFPDELYLSAYATSIFWG